MRLIIAEKPSVAGAIAAVVNAKQKQNGYTEGGNYLVSWCYGHIMEMKQPNEYCDEWAGTWCFEQLPMIPDRFQFKVKDNVKSQFSVLKNLMNDGRVTDIICATDADREGECIFRYVFNSAGCRKPVYRLWVSSLEDSAIRKAFTVLKSSSEYNSLFSAGYSRARADWLVGMNYSRLFSVRYKANLPIGRVQTPTLAMIVQRDYKVSHFVKEQFFTVDINCGGFTASSERIDSIDDAKEIMLAVFNDKTVFVASVKKEAKTVNPPKLYDLTTLQREANKHYGYTAQQTLTYLQKLYEAKLTTYPRTDCQYLPDDMKSTAESVIKTVYSVYPSFGICPVVVNIDRSINNAKVTGHHAIIPTENIAFASLNELPEGEKNILYLISAKLVLASEGPHKYEAVKVELISSSANTVFTAKGRTVLHSGWKALEQAIFPANNKEKPDKEDSVIPELCEGQILSDVQPCVSEHWTSPPVPYTEDTLLSAMEHAGNDSYDDEDAEKKGLGTPATRAAIIEQLVSHKLVQRKGKQILPTDMGKKLIAVVPPEIRSPKLTAAWEMKLQQIERKEYDAEQFMTEIKQYVIDTCEKYSSVDEKVSFEAKPIGNCPKCGAEVKQGKFGYYCTGKCGMNVAKVYNKELSEGQLSKLLSGQKISLTINGKKSTVLPQIEPFSYKNKKGEEISGFQWCCFLDEVIKKFGEHADEQYKPFL